FLLTTSPTNYIYTLSLHDALPIYNDIHYSSIALYATPEIRKKLSSLPLLGRPPKITYQSVIMKMMNTPQTATQSVLEHGMSVNRDRKSTRLNSSHLGISYAVFCLK